MQSAKRRGEAGEPGIVVVSAQTQLRSRSLLYASRWSASMAAVPVSCSMSSMYFSLFTAFNLTDLERCMKLGVQAILSE